MIFSFERLFIRMIIHPDEDYKKEKIMDKRKVLFYTESWGVGGIESFIMNTVETLNLEEFEFNIFSTHDSNNQYDERIKELGGKRFVVFSGQKPNLIRRLVTSMKVWNSLLKADNYDIVHINTMNGTGFLYSFFAKLNNVKVRVVHSHNSSFASSGMLEKNFKNAIHKISRLLFGSTATSRLACSKDAGKYLFGKKAFQVLQNGIDTNRFQFDAENRKVVRRDCNVPEDALVFGSIGRLEKVKNPVFQVDILHELHRRGICAYLFLVGAGTQEKEVRRKAKDLSLEQFLIMPGLTHNPEKYLSSLDVFTMPSVFEGAPFSVIEAFANGLPMILSDRIPSAPINMGWYEQHLPIGHPSLWASAVAASYKKISLATRIEQYQRAYDLGLDRTANTQQLESIYRSL